MQELITPGQSDTLVLFATLFFALLGGVCGWRAVGKRGLVGAIPGVLILPLWMFHQWITRYDPQSGYFGLDKVKVLLMEVVLFVVLGVVLGWVWNTISRRDAEIGAERAK
jgi:uncharacterized membrane protein YeaQ/YmgE (transglycosylase-associated protein family)